MTIRAVAITPLLCVGVIFASAEVDPGPAANMRKADEQLASSFTCSFVVHSPASFMFADARQGQMIRRCDLTQADGERAIICNFEYSSPPVYGEPGTLGYQAGDFDNDGHLIVWRTLESHTLLSRGDGVAREVIQSHRVSRSGDVVSDEPYFRLRLFPADGKSYSAETDRPLLVLGRGLADHLDEVVDIKPDSVGQLRLVGRGAYGPRGTWDVVIDPGERCLARRATFTPDGASQPQIRIETEGVSAPGLAKRGTFTLLLTDSLRLTESVEVDSVALSPSPRIFDEVRRRHGEPLPAGKSEIMDHRTSPAVRTFPGEGGATKLPSAPEKREP